MSAERASRQVGGLRLAGSPRSDGVGAWLGVLERMLRLPSREAAAIREELESHVRERVRDLVVTGMDEGEAVRCAVSELGDAAALAQRYRRARALPRRRLMMNLAMLGLTGVVVAGGAVTLSQPRKDGGVPVSVFEPAALSEQASEAAQRTFSIEAREETLENVLKMAAQLAGVSLDPMWRTIEESGVPRDAGVTYIDSSATVGEVMNAIADDVALTGSSRLDYRLDDGVLRVSTAGWFDRQEMLLASYDISGLAAGVEPDEVVMVLHTYVHPDAWIDNGGDLGKMSVVGERLFVQAPRRFHRQIQWFLAQLSEGAEVAAGSAPVAPSTAGPMR